MQYLKDQSCWTNIYKKRNQLTAEENMEVIKKKYSTCYLFEALNDERYDKLKVFFVCQKKKEIFIFIF
jgi:hypothetical protein